MSRLDKLIKTRDDAEAGTAKARTPHERHKHQHAYERAIRKMKGLEEKLSRGGKNEARE